MWYNIFSFALFLQFTLGQQCGDVCYQNLNERLKSFKECCRTPNLFLVPTSFSEIRTLINQTEEIISNIPDVTDIRTKLQEINATLTSSAENIKLLKKLADIINEIDKNIQELKIKKEYHNGAVNECLMANTNYEELRHDVEQIKTMGEEVTVKLGDTLKRIDEIIKKNMDTQNELDKIDISEDTFAKYLCSSQLPKTVEDIISTTKRIAEHLEALFNKFTKVKLGELEAANKINEENIAKINMSINENPTEKSNIKITKETNSTIEDLRKKLADLKDRTKKLEQDNDLAQQKTSEKLDEYFKELLKEEELILNHLFSEENKNRVKEEIKKANEYLDTINILTEKRYEIKEDLENSKATFELLNNSGTCNIAELVAVEESIS